MSMRAHQVFKQHLMFHLEGMYACHVQTLDVSMDQTRLSNILLMN